MTSEDSKAAVTALVNFHYRQPLARYWGDGTLSSSDGQRFPVRGKVRNASALPRYFGYGEGITFYSWSSDQSATSGKAGGLKKVEPLKAVDAVNRSKRFGCEPPTGGPSYHRSI